MGGRMGAGWHIPTLHLGWGAVWSVFTDAGEPGAVAGFVPFQVEASVVEEAGGDGEEGHEGDACGEEEHEVGVGVHAVVDLADGEAADIGAAWDGDGGNALVLLEELPDGGVEFDIFEGGARRVDAVFDSAGMAVGGGEFATIMAWAGWPWVLRRWAAWRSVTASQVLAAARARKARPPRMRKMPLRRPVRWATEVRCGEGFWAIRRLI